MKQYTITCPICSKQFDVTISAAGKRATCSMCNEPFTIPKWEDDPKGPKPPMVEELAKPTPAKPKRSTPPPRSGTLCKCNADMIRIHKDVPVLWCKGCGTLRHNSKEYLPELVQDWNEWKSEKTKPKKVKDHGSYLRDLVL